MIKLTQKQQSVLDFICEHQQLHGAPPTRMEIAQQLGFRSANAAEDHLKALEKKGVLTIMRGTSRGIRLIEENIASVMPLGLPLLGQVAAGSPLLASENVDRYCQVCANLFSPPADYLLSVRGNSMIKIGICDQDWVAVHKTHEVKNGDVVVARLHDEVTVKRWQRQQDTILLCPENDQMQPIMVQKNQHDLVVEGLVVGVIRRGV
jgi:repressor LexA